MSRSPIKIVKRQRESHGNSRDDREPRIRALSLLDLRRVALGGISSIPNDDNWGA
jgi:hypothetical protein